MANEKGNPQNLKSMPLVEKVALGGQISIRVVPEDEVKLRAMGKDMQRFIRAAIASALRDNEGISEQNLQHREGAGCSPKASNE